MWTCELSEARERSEAWSFLVGRRDGTSVPVVGCSASINHSVDAYGAGPSLINSCGIIKTPMYGLGHVTRSTLQLKLVIRIFLSRQIKFRLEFILWTNCFIIIILDVIIFTIPFWVLTSYWYFSSHRCYFQYQIADLTLEILSDDRILR